MPSRSRIVFRYSRRFRRLMVPAPAYSPTMHEVERSSFSIHAATRSRSDSASFEANGGMVRFRNCVATFRHRARLASTSFTEVSFRKFAGFFGLFGLWHA